MLGGITAWTAASLPAHANQPPSIPDITGPAKGKPGSILTYTVQSVDPDGDDIYYCINWSDGTEEICIGPYVSGESIEVTHSWSVQGTYVVRAKAFDRYEDESAWGTLEVQMPRFIGLSGWIWLETHFPIVSFLLSLLF